MKVSPDVKPPIRFKKRRVALFLGYLGERYHGMQINPGVTTIEKCLLDALHKAELLSDQNYDHPGKMSLMRSARTDKGVSAAAQCVSIKLDIPPQFLKDYPAAVRQANSHLPEDIRIFGMLQCTMAFNARQDCQQRRYEYIFPLKLLGGPNHPQNNPENSSAGDPRVNRLSSILKAYEGSHCFANFTEGLAASEDASRRYMIRVKCQQPFLPPGAGVYYVVVEVFGQSFLLHQIRKMVGLALIIFHGHAPEESISVALSPHVRFPTPMAPAEGLLLDKLYFETYNKNKFKFLETPVSDNAFAETKKQFKSDRIYYRIAEKERLDRVLEAWVNTCSKKVSLSRDDILQLHQKFILTDSGKEETRKMLVASLYPIRTDMETFMDTSESKNFSFVEDVRNQFEKRFDTRATFLVRAPGRVILIGEHLDYNGFPVITAAMKQGTIVAGCLDDTREVEINHFENDKYAKGRITNRGIFEQDGSGAYDSRDKRWLSYVSWGVKMFTNDMKGARHVTGGGRVLIGGDLPRAGGLASSSSLSSAAVLMAARMNRRRMPRQQLATLAAEGERGGAGTRGGSVDHVTSFCAKKDHVLEVSFVPHLKVRHITWPSGARLFAVDSMTTAEKGLDNVVKSEYNLRAAECRVASALLARRLDVHLAKTVTTPGQLMKLAGKSAKLGCKDVSALRVHVNMVMDRDESISLEEVRKELKVSDQELLNRFLRGTKAEQFAVGKRMAHVFSEAERVELFGQILEDQEIVAAVKIEELGKILNEGHTSLRENYETSVDAVDELVEFCLKNGAAGSRMTGAGWGGYAVNLLSDDKAGAFYQAAVDRVGEEGVVEICPWSGAAVFAIHQTLGVTRGRKRGSNDESKGTDKSTAP